MIYHYCLLYFIVHRLVCTAQQFNTTRNYSKYCSTNTNGVISIEKAWSPDDTDNNKADMREKGTMMQAETKMKKSRQDQHN